MADKKKMSVAEILAAARGAKGKEIEPLLAVDLPAAQPPSTEPAAAESEVAATPSSKPASKSAVAPGVRPNVADILALARANKAAAAAEAVSKPVAAEKPAAPAKGAAAKAVAPAAVGRKGVERDTASILAAARAAAKPGPVSKADAPPRPVAKPKPAAEKAVVVKPPPPRPARPAPAAKSKVDSGEDRRGFLELATGSFLAVGFTALSVTGGLFTLGMARFFFPNVLAEPPSKFKVGFREGFPTGKVETKFVAQYGVWVVNGEVQGEQQIYALKTVCTHLGCTPSWLEAEQKFKCPCHGSGFYKDGVNFEGPAPRPLERYAIRTADDGQLEVDKSRTFHEETGQWADPACYVTA